MHDRQLPSQRQHSTLGRSVRQLRRGTPDQRNNTRRVDDAALALLVSPHAQHRMFTSKPHALDVDVLRQVPNLLGGVDGIGVVRVHDSGIVEDHICAAPGVLGLDHSLDLGFLGDVALDGLNAGRVRNELSDLREGFFESRRGDVCHQDIGAFAGKQDASFESNTAVVLLLAALLVYVGLCVLCGVGYPAAPVMMAFLPWRRPRGVAIARIRIRE